MMYGRVVTIRCHGAKRTAALTKDLPAMTHLSRVLDDEQKAETVKPLMMNNRRLRFVAVTGPNLQ